MEITWKFRGDWPEVMTVKDLVDCIPFVSRDQAYEIMKAVGTRVGNNWAISKSQIIYFLDGDYLWPTGKMAVAVKAIEISKEK